MDYFLHQLHCDRRLLKEYKEHGNLIVAVDFDNTIYDYHGIGLEFFDVVSILKVCNSMDFPVVIFTANQDHKLVHDYCEEIGVEIAGINVNVLPGFGKGKIYYNVLLDDRAGLKSAFDSLEYVLDYIENMVP